jgi:hypothetical protein
LRALHDRLSRKGDLDGGYARFMVLNPCITISPWYSHFATAEDKIPILKPCRSKVNRYTGKGR